MSWIDFWNGRTTLYANERHKRAHYWQIAGDIIAFLPHRGARVLDYGCGEALCADTIAACCGHLYLCDGAEAVRAGLSERAGRGGNVSVISPRELETIADGSLDLIVANSVVQYLTATELESVLAVFGAKLAPGGSLVLGDIIPRTVGPLTDALALLRFAKAQGFLVAAGIGLVRTLFSSYRRTRARLGLLQFDEREIVARLAAGGFDAHRHHTNLGHNAARMAVIAVPARHAARAGAHAA